MPNRDKLTKRCLVVIGPTASGKTALTHKLCEDLGFLRPVNLDAFQFYRGLDWGTAKPMPDVRECYGYRMIDILEPTQRIDAQTYATLAKDNIRQISAAGETAICVGGSGLYLRALTRGLNELPGANDRLRAFLRSCATQWGWDVLHAWLSHWDSARAAQLHPNDRTRIERALEIYLLSGRRPSELYTQQSQQQGKRLDGREIQFFVIRVSPKSEVLRANIWQRAAQMVNAQWLEEVCSLLEAHGPEILQAQSFQAIGYLAMAEFISRHKLLEQRKRSAHMAHLAGLTNNGSWDELTEKIAVATWQYARRQCTWNNQEQVNFDWKDFDSSKDLLDYSEPYHHLLAGIRLFLSEGEVPNEN